jgi:hypothetical protein
MNYQAAVRGTNGQPLAQKRITVRFSIRNNGPDGPIVYSETHSADTDEYGLFDLVVGGGNPVTGSYASINWAQTDKYLQVEVDPTGLTDFKPLMTTRLLSVPYAVIADSALKGGGGGGGDGWGSQSAITLPPLTGNGTGAAPIRLQNGTTAGHALIWDGNSWTPGPAGGDDWGGQTAAVAAPLVGNGTVSNPIRLSAPTGAGIMMWNGSQWTAADVATDATLEGSGTPSNPLSIASQGATQGQVLKWNGSTWSPANDDVSGGSGPLQVSPRISGNGTAGSPLDLAGQGAGMGQVLKWNGTSWAPANDEVGGGGTTYTAGAGIAIAGGVISAADAVVGNEVANATFGGGLVRSGDGSAGNPYTLGLPTSGVTAGQVMKWNGTSWAPANDEVGGGGTTYTAGAGIAIAGGVISAADAVVGNEVVGATFGGGLVRSGDGSAGNPYTLGLPTTGVTAGQVMTWNGSNWAPAAPQAGNITMTGTNGVSVNPASGTSFTVSLPSGTTSGQVLTWNGSTWMAQAPSGGGAYTAGNGISIAGNQISHTIWTEASGNAYKSSGRVGIGTSSPGATLDVSANSTDALPTLLINETENDFARIGFKNSAATPQWGIFARPQATGATGMLKFNYSTGNIDVMTLTHDGKVGINNNSPNTEGRVHMLTNTRLGGIFETNHTTDGNRAVALEGIYSSTQAYDGTGVRGTSEPQPGRGTGGRFYGGGIGVVGSVMQNFVGTYALTGVYGEAGTATANQQGTRMGVYGLGTGGQYSIGVYGTAQGAAANGANFAAYFNGAVGIESGDLEVQGFISKLGGTFKIDHPLDPENKYLSHSFVESPDMMNVYNGNVVTDAAGYATVELPSYFEALNEDYRYQLTTIGEWAQACVWKEINGNRFVIRTDKPGVKVSWQVTGIRKDPVAKMRRVVPETQKRPEHRGKYLAPEAYGKSEEQRIAVPHQNLSPTIYRDMK